MGEELCDIELGLGLGGGCRHVHSPHLPSHDWFSTRMKEECRTEDGDEKESARKKLRLTKEQLASLEDGFRARNILNLKQKQDLATRLNLKPRQVEVWFQNRRARTKLKQTQVDCEFWKKCCESLSLENRRLRKELQQLRLVKLRSPPPPFNVQRLKAAAAAAASLAVCPSCERINTNKHASRSSSSMAC